MVRKMFDPLQSNVNYKTVKKSVRSVMEPILDLKDKVHFERIEWVWCLAILEMLIANATWDGCIYQLLPYLRMRYLYKAIALWRKRQSLSRTKYFSLCRRKDQLHQLQYMLHFNFGFAEKLSFSPN
ncbi:hypothetical protein JG688_00013767 [Phytophthora aleatoria]|uniref:Uncharacterized protein n=1 Tax=Phytophthora aleatoria TaxID=2496075 RepID=A0A8J5I8I5_9STRA|nr:hypothetical protein JG688_00013767 [Phytophthora aleatoria]